MRNPTKICRGIFILDDGDASRRLTFLPRYNKISAHRSHDPQISRSFALPVVLARPAEFLLPQLYPHRPRWNCLTNFPASTVGSSSSLVDPVCNQLVEIYLPQIVTLLRRKKPAIELTQVKQRDLSQKKIPPLMKRPV